MTLSESLSTLRTALKAVAEANRKDEAERLNMTDRLKRKEAWKKRKH